MIIEIKAAIPIEFNREYYTVDEEVKEKRAPCTCCDNTGKVKIKGEEYTCPRCKGNWREKEIIGSKTVYSVAKWKLDRIDLHPHNIILRFSSVNKKNNYWGGLDIEEKDFSDMIIKNYRGDKKIYGDYKEAIAEVKRINAEEKAKEK